MQPVAEPVAAPTRTLRLPKLLAPAWLRPALGVALIAALLFVAQALAMAARQPIAIPLAGRAAEHFLDGFHAPEQDGARPFRWTSGAARLAFDLPGAGAALALDLWLGAAPPGRPAPALTLAVDSRPYASIQPDSRPRRYRVLLPEARPLAARMTIALQSEAVSVPPDTRLVGLRFEGAGLAAPGARLLWPTPALALAELALLALAAALLRHLGAPRLVSGAAALALALALLALAWAEPLIAFSYAARLAVALAGLAALTYGLLPALERWHERVALHSAHPLAPGGRSSFMRALWGIALLACCIRLAGALYPLFAAHDLPLNVERLVRTLSGTLVSTNRSFEFRSGVTIYPPGPYLALAPALLAGVTPALLVQGGNALVDGLGALAAGALALTLGASRRDALLAALLYAALPVSLTSLYWGHSAQVFGQGLMAPLAMVLLAAFYSAGRGEREKKEELRGSPGRPSVSGRARLWGVAGALLAIAFLSHIGVSILAIAWLGLAWLALLARRTLPPAAARRLTVTLAAAGLAGLALVYGPELGFKIEQTAQVGERVLSEGYASSSLIARAFQISFYELGIWLLPPGLLLLRHLAMPPGGGVLVGAWLAAALIFLLVELATGLQVRYLVFLAPLACMAQGVLLGRMAARGSAGRLVAWGAALLMVAQGCAAWYAGTFADIQMSMVPLLR